jgi:cytosine/adenosine deaminase-related metal-dependent hydrolase
VLRVRAGSVHPVTAPPITDGAVLVDGGGRIAALGPDAQVPVPAHAVRLDFPDASLVPGLVNTHAHLELTHLAGRNSEREFPRWIRTIRALKDATPPAAFYEAALQGVRDCWAVGVTCVADTGSSGAAAAALHALGGRGIAFQEAFGPDPARAGAGLAELEGALDRLGGFASARVRLGVSPHAPYTVSEPLYRAVDDLARVRGLPVALHLAESVEETALVRDGNGPFAEALRARGIRVAPRGVSPVQYLSRLGVLRRGTLCIHCVQVDQADVAALARAEVSVAHCPRSNTSHGHGTAPLAAFRQAGLTVGLGTDSVVSTTDVNLWAEAAAAGLQGSDALRMVTLDGARALGLECDIGTLEVGKEADLAVFPGPLPGAPGDGRSALLTIVAGRVVHG